MEKIRKQTRLKTIPFLIIILPLLGLTLYSIFYNINDINKIKNKNNKLEKQLVNLKDEYKKLEEETKTNEEKVNYLKDIDKNIEELKQKVFEKAKLVETKIQNNESDKKIAYLTFDDGPYYLTDSVLNILKEKQVKATFFTIGVGKEKCLDKRSVSCLDTYKRIVDNGHTIANHTYSHSIFYGLYSSVDSFIEQVQKQEDLIFDKTGVKTNIVRFPGGAVTAGKLKNGIIQKLNEKGYGWIDWTAEDGDGRDLQSKEQAWNLLKGSVKDNIEVILMHDYNDITYSILPDVIDYLENEGYILLPLFYDSVMVNK